MVAITGKTAVALTTIVALFWSVGLADLKITFIDAGQADAAVVQIEQPTGEPYTIVVDGGDGDSDLKDNLPAILASDPTIELVVLSHPHKDHTGALDWLVSSESPYSVNYVWWTGENYSEGNYNSFAALIAARGIPAFRPEEAVYAVEGLSNFQLWVLNNGQEFHAL